MYNVLRKYLACALLHWSQVRSVNFWLGHKLVTKIWLFDPQQGQGILLISKMFQQILGSTQSSTPHSICTKGFSQGWTWWGMKLTTHLHVVPKLKIHGTIPPLPHTDSWHALGNFSLCLITALDLRFSQWQILQLGLWNLTSFSHVHGWPSTKLHSIYMKHWKTQLTCGLSPALYFLWTNPRLSPWCFYPATSDKSRMTLKT
jgi:hypothetical protein